jgi:hypothetical protein
MSLPSERKIAMALEHRHRLHGRALGAAIGGVAGLCAAAAVHLVVEGDNSGLFALPATLATAIFVGVGAGLMFASIVIGGREDDRATRAAHEAIANDHARPAEPLA